MQKLRPSRSSVSSIATSFIDNEAPKFHPALNVPSYWDEKKKRYEAKHDWTDLQLALERYAEHHKDDKDQVFPTSVDECTWDDVFSQMETAQVRYDSEGNKSLNFFRRMWTKAGNRKKDVDPWLELLPEEYGLGIVRGGIALVFHLAKKSADAQQKVVDMTAEMMDVVSLARPKRKVLGSDEQIEVCTQELYFAVLEAVSDIVRYLIQRVEKRHFREILKNFNRNRSIADLEAGLQKVRSRAKDLGDAYDTKIDEHIVETHSMQAESRKDLADMGPKVDDINMNVLSIREGVDEVDSRVTKVGDQITTVDATTRDTLAGIRGVKAEVTGLGGRIDEGATSINSWMKIVDSRISQGGQMLDRSIHGTSDAVKALGDRLDDVVVEMQYTRALILSQNGFGVIAKNSLHQEIQNRVWESFARDAMAHQAFTDPSFLLPAPNIPRPSTPGPRMTAHVTLPQLLGILDVPLDVSNTDLATVLSHKHRFSHRAHATAQSLLSTPQFTRWLSTPGAALLLVDGNDRAAATMGLSVMSLLSASLVGSLANLRPAPTTLVVSFFCGLHADADDALSGPRGMVRLLLAQVLLTLQARRALDLSFVDSAGKVEALRAHDLPTLCHALLRAVQQLPPDLTVYVVLDGVASFERDWRGFREQLDTFVGTVGFIARLDGFRGAFKVLMTSPYRSIHVRKMLLEEAQYVLLGSAQGTPGYISERSVSTGLLGAGA